MPFGQISITVTGNLTDDPQLRYTPNGVPVTTFTVATTERVKDGSGGWADGDTVFLRADCWRALAEHAAESLRKGSRVVVTGTLRARRWETKEGESRTSWEIRADEVAASLTFATVVITKAGRSNGPVPEDPWASPASGDDEPPF